MTNMQPFHIIWNGVEYNTSHLFFNGTVFNVTAVSYPRQRTTRDSGLSCNFTISVPQQPAPC